MSDIGTQPMTPVAVDRSNVDSKLLLNECLKRESIISGIQKQLKDSETILSQALYQCKVKLKAIRTAQENPVDSEDLIRYAHRISADHSVNAPSDWEPGDQRRPYPQDVDMRNGFLGNIQQVPPGTPYHSVINLPMATSQLSAPTIAAVSLTNTVTSPEWKMMSILAASRLDDVETMSGSDSSSSSSDSE